MCARRQQLKRLLMIGLLLAAFFVSAEESLGLREYQVPLIENQIHSRLFLQTLLEVGGSDVRLPEDFPNQKIDVNGPMSRISLTAWNMLLNDFGVTLLMGRSALTLQVDLKTYEAKLDAFEDQFITLFKVEREAVFIRYSDEDHTGPAVVLVHGLDSSKRLFSGTCRFLVAKGYDVYFFEYPNDDRVERNAERLSKALKTFPEEDKQRGISLVTVSMGGVISQLMLETPSLQVDGVTRFIACVPPFQGSEMAALRGVIEVGDHTLSIFFDPKKSLDFWGDGMGRAGIDLLPRSLLMEKLDQLERNPKVTYSILAGNKGMFDPALLIQSREALAKEPSENSLAETARLLTLDRMDLLLKFQSPNGDGVVTLESAKLDGVTDRVILPYGHLEFLTGFKADERIPALKEVLERLPPVGE